MHTQKIFKIKREQILLQQNYCMLLLANTPIRES